MSYGTAPERLIGETTTDLLYEDGRKKDSPENVELAEVRRLQQVIACCRTLAIFVRDYPEVTDNLDMLIKLLDVNTPPDLKSFRRRDRRG